MANGILPLFGPTPEELEYKKRQDREALARQDYRDRLAGAGQGLGMYGGLAQQGVRLGENLRTMKLFGEAPSPDMERADVMQEVMNKFGKQDMSNPQVIAQMAKELSDMGYPREAMQFMEEAKASSSRLQQANRKTQLDDLELKKKTAEIAKLNKEASEAGKGKQLTVPLLEDFEKKGGAVEQMTSLRSSFKPEYAGKFPKLGEIQLALANKFPQSDEDREFALWWKGYQDRINVIRNDLFGSALTDPERIEFEKAMVKLDTDPKLVIQYLEKAENLAKKKFRSQQTIVEKQGWNISGVEGYAPSLMGTSGEAATGTGEGSGEWTVREKNTIVM